MAFPTTCPLCELEKRQMEDHTAMGNGQAVYCMSCDRRSTPIPHELRPHIFGENYSQEKRNRIAKLMATGVSCQDAVKQVDAS